jgi:hypothetical protein
MIAGSCRFVAPACQTVTVVGGSRGVLLAAFAGMTVVELCYLIV